MIVAIEGGDQAGKTTQTAMLARALRKRGISTATFSFPNYKTPIGQEISRYLARKRRFTPHVIHCLLSANRWEKLDEILNAVSKNPVVIMNRYYHSNLIYGLANGMDPTWLENLDKGLPRADFVILLDVSKKESFHRKKTGRDKFEENEAFLQKIFTTYRDVAKKRRWGIVDASKPKHQVHQDIMKLLSKRLDHEKIS